MESYLHALLIAVLDVDKWLASRPICFIPVKKPSASIRYETVRFPDSLPSMWEKKGISTLAANGNASTG
jgi:hypothetical protein